MKRLVLLRHAKSSWAGDRADEARPLNARGERAAHLMGIYMKQARLKPDLILCSSAERTRQTVAILLDVLGPGIAVEYRPSLYLASVETMVEMIEAAEDGAETLMVVGHNPGTQETALTLSQDDESALRSELVDKFPTAGLAVIEFDATKWSAIRPGTLVDFRKPKSLV